MLLVGLREADLPLRNVSFFLKKKKKRFFFFKKARIGMWQAFETKRHTQTALCVNCSSANT